MKPLYPETIKFANETHQLALDNKISDKVFSPEWAFLQGSEQKLKAIMNKVPEPESGGDAEYGLGLYWIHQMLPDIKKKIIWPTP
jgi:hypothetical protein